MVLAHGITWTRWVRGARWKFLIAWPRSGWDNPEMCPGGRGPVVIAAVLCAAGSEPARWW